MTEKSNVLIAITDPISEDCYRDDKQNAILSELSNRTVVNVISNDSIKKYDGFLSELIRKPQITDLCSSTLLAKLLTSVPINTQLILLGQDKQIWPLRQRLLLLGVLPNQIQLYGFDTVKTLFCGHCHNRWEICQDWHSADSCSDRISNNHDYCDMCENDVAIQNHFSPFYGAYLTLPCH
jgi:hypothetical protein